MKNKVVACSPKRRAYLPKRRVYPPNRRADFCSVQKVFGISLHQDDRGLKVRYYKVKNAVAQFIGRQEDQEERKLPPQAKKAYRRAGKNLNEEHL